jgi:CBS domain-containing protein
MDARALDADRSGVISDEELALSAQNRAIVGIITERDFLNAVARGTMHKDTKVYEIMTSFLDAELNISRLVYVCPQMPVLAAMETMTQHRLRQVPVIESQGIGPDNLPIAPRVLGVVSIGEVLKTLLAETRLEIDHLESFILGNHEYSAGDDATTSRVGAPA